jgi:hypothetical protein
METYYTPKKETIDGVETEVFYLEVEGVVAKDKLEEFRTNNHKLTNELKKLKEDFDGIDPEEARKLIEIKSDLDAEKLMKKEGIDKVVEQRTIAMKTEYEKKLKAQTEANLALTSRLTEVEINQATLSAATEKGLKPTAIPDITSRARATFKLVDGKPIAHDKEGKPIYGKDGTNPLTIADWVEEQVTSAPHLFEPNKGGGSGNGGNTGSASNFKGNPFKKGADWNLTTQMELSKKNPQLAERLAAEAGR